MEDYKEVWGVYRTLLHRFMKACQAGDNPRKETLFELLRAFQLEFPQECEAYERAFG